MTIQDLINSVDELMPNSYTENTKLKWVNELEGRVQADVFLLAPEEFKQSTLDDELLIEYPHDKLYEPYLIAKIQFADGEYGNYQNSMQMFNSFWAEFVCWFARTYKPGDRRKN